MNKREFGHEPATFTKNILGVFKRQTPSIQNEYVSYYQDFDDSNIYMRRLKGRNDPKDIAFYSSDTHKGTDEVKPFGYKRDILFGSGKPYSTGHLKDL
jgi:hypothetical protein